MDEPVLNPRQQLPVVVPRNPMLEQHTGPLRTIVMSLGLLAVVVLVLYGMSRPEAPQQMASAPSAATQAQPASGNAPAQKPAPSTTGQGQTGEQPKPAQ